MSDEPLKLRADWRDDCQGKKDYDGEILSISSRYWPQSYRRAASAEIQHSATSCLMLHFDDKGADDYLVLCQKEFEGPTLEAVKVEVEAWAQAQMESVTQLLRGAYAETERSLWES